MLPIITHVLIYVCEWFGIQSKAAVAAAPREVLRRHLPSSLSWPVLASVCPYLSGAPIVSQLRSTSTQGLPLNVKTDNVLRLNLGEGFKSQNAIYLNFLHTGRHTLRNSHISSFPPFSAPSALVLTWSIVICSALACLCSFPVISIPSLWEKERKKNAPRVQESNWRESSDFPEGIPVVVLV